MKKYGMFILSIVIILSTISIYIYENTNLPLSSYKEPEINFRSNKFGNIKNIVWGMAGNYNDYLFVLADNAPNTERNTSNIYYLNINTGKHGVIASFETNENFKNYMGYLQWDYLYFVSKDGINSIRPSIDPTTGSVYCNNLPYYIPDFNNVDSFAIGNQIYYTKSTDKLLYILDMQNWGFSFSNPGSQNSTKAIYVDADKVILSTDWRTVCFTKRERNGMNLYEMGNRNGSGGVGQKLAARNFIYLRDSIFLYGGFITLADEGSEFGILYEGSKIGKINKNTDLQGQIPDMQFKAVNNTIEVFHSSFNADHIGSIYSLHQYSKKGTEIVKDQPIIGPIRVSRSLINPKLLFSTYENGKVHFKTCNSDGSELTDITKLIE